MAENTSNTSTPNVISSKRDVYLPQNQEIFGFGAKRKMDTTTMSTGFDEYEKRVRIEDAPHGNDISSKGPQHTVSGSEFLQKDTQAWNRGTTGIPSSLLNSTSLSVLGLMEAGIGVYQHINKDDVFRGIPVIPSDADDMAVKGNDNDEDIAVSCELKFNSNHYKDHPIFESIRINSEIVRGLPLFAEPSHYKKSGEGGIFITVLGHYRGVHTLNMVNSRDTEMTYGQFKRLPQFHGRHPRFIWPSTPSDRKEFNRPIQMYTTERWNSNPGIVRDSAMGDNLIQTVMAGTIRSTPNYFMQAGIKPVSGARCYWICVLRVKGKEDTQTLIEKRGQTYPIRDTDIVYQRIEPHVSLETDIQEYVYSTPYFEGDYYEIGTIQYHSKEADIDNKVVYKEKGIYSTEKNHQLSMAFLDKLPRCGLFVNESQI